MNKPQFQEYINNFRRHLGAYLRPGMGFKSYVYPTSGGGGVLVFELGRNQESSDFISENTQSVGSILNNLDVKAFGGNLENIHFSGTNMVLEGNKIIFIKDNSPSEWTDKASKKEAEKVLNFGS